MEKVKIILRYIWIFLNSPFFDFIGGLLIIYFTGRFGVSLGSSLHSPSIFFGVLLFISSDVLHNSITRALSER